MDVPRIAGSLRLKARGAARSRTARHGPIANRAAWIPLEPRDGSASNLAGPLRPDSAGSRPQSAREPCLDPRGRRPRSPRPDPSCPRPRGIAPGARCIAGHRDSGRVPGDRALATSPPWRSPRIGELHSRKVGHSWRPVVLPSRETSELPVLCDIRAYESLDAQTGVILVSGNTRVDQRCCACDRARVDQARSMAPAFGGARPVVSASTGNRPQFRLCTRDTPPPAYFSRADPAHFPRAVSDACGLRRYRAVRAPSDFAACGERRPKALSGSQKRCAALEDLVGQAASHLRGADRSGLRHPAQMRADCAGTGRFGRAHPRRSRGPPRRRPPARRTRARSGAPSGEAAQPARPGKLPRSRARARGEGGLDGAEIREPFAQARLRLAATRIHAGGRFMVPRAPTRAIKGNSGVSPPGPAPGLAWKSRREPCCNS